MYKEDKSKTVDLKKTKMKKENLFEVGQKIVVPMRGVGVVEDVVMFYDAKCYKIRFLKDDFCMHVPLSKLEAHGLRTVCSQALANQVLGSLKKTIRINKGIWSKRAQEYEGKIYSGEIMLIAQVVRELKAVVDKKESSYSENNVYNLALNRLVEELSISLGLNEFEVFSRIQSAIESSADYPKVQIKNEGDFADEDF